MKVKSLLRYLIIFLVTVTVLLTALVVSALIPRKSIQKNMEKSAGVLLKSENAHFMIKDAPESRIDSYADVIWLSIAYGYNNKAPLSSVLWSKFYREEGLETNEAFYRQIVDKAESNQEYLRYWHGGNTLVRLFHLFTDIQGMYIFNCIAMFITIAVFIYILWTNAMRSEAIATILSLLAVGIWYVPLCLEYTWVIEWALIASIMAVHNTVCGRFGNLGVLFMVIGMVAIYLDFLTTETLALLIPLLLTMAAKRSVSGSWDRNDTKLTVKYAILWLVGYVGMWVSKWIVSAVVLRINVLPYVTGHVAQWLGNEVSDGVQYSMPELIYYALIGNLQCVFPFNLKSIGIFVFVVFLLLYSYFCFVYKDKNAYKELIVLYIFLSFIPFARIVIMHSHAFRHLFFTHRAFAGTILALMLVLIETTNGRWPKNAPKKSGRA